MPVAKDVATFAAVVPPDKVAEIAFARRVVADGGFGVGLPVLARRGLRDVGEEIEIPFAIDAALAALAGATAHALADDAAEAHEASVGAAQRHVRARVGARVARS